MGGVDPDLVLALADGVDGLVSSREECLVKRDRRRFPLFIGAEIGTVRVSVTEILVEKLVHRIELAAVQRFLKIGPVLDLLLLTFGQDGGICDIQLVTNGFLDRKSKRLNSSH